VSAAALTTLERDFSDALAKATGYEPRRVGSEWKGLCPVHGDTHPSLDFHEENDKILVTCRSRGCEGESIFAATGWKSKTNHDTFAGRPVRARYTYHDGKGREIVQKIRFDDTEEAGKKCRFSEKLHGAKLDLYRLPDVLAAVKEGRAVYVTEGEKDADALAALGLVGTSAPYGAVTGAKVSGKWLGAHTDALADADVVLLQDADPAGAEHVENVARLLAGRVKSLRVVPPFPGPKGADVSDYLAANGREATLAFIAAAEEPKLTTEAAEPAAPAPAEKKATEPENGAKSEVETTSEPQFPVPPAPEAFHGLAGEFVRLVEPHTEADPVALLAHFLVYFGNAVGRGPFFRIGTGGRHHTNEYAALVGLTGAGRKGTAENEARHPFVLTGDPWSSRIISGLSSGEGLISAVRDAVKEQKSVREKGGGTHPENVVSDAGVEDKRVCFRETELGRVLRIMDRDGNTLSATIRQLWDGEDVLQTITKNSPTVATGAHGSIVGHVTAEELRRELDRVEVANGFGNRFIWLAVRRTKFLPDGGSLRDGDLYQLVEKLRDALARARAVREMQRDDEATKAWHIVYEPLDTPRPGLSGAMTARAAPHVLRLSMIYALLDGSAIIGLPHLDAALALWTYAEDSVRFVFGDATGDPEADTILSALRRTERLSRNDIYNDLFHRHTTAPRIEAALGILKKYGLAHMTTEATGGRPAEFWRAGRAEGIS